MRTVALIFIISAIALPSHAQFIQNPPIVKSELKSTSTTYNKIKKAKAIRTFNGVINISFTIENDFSDGIFAVYKSIDFANPVLIDVIEYSNNNLKNKPINFVSFDTTLDMSYNMCHIVKIEKNSTIFASYGNQITRSMADMKIENDF